MPLKDRLPSSSDLKSRKYLEGSGGLKLFMLPIAFLFFLLVGMVWGGGKEYQSMLVPIIGVAIFVICIIGMALIGRSKPGS